MTTTSSTTPSSEPDRLPPHRAVDAHDARGVLAGDYGTQHNYFTGRGPVSFPHRVGVVPGLADQRLDRPADADLAAALAGDLAVVVCQVLAGLGGVGKTQLAANLAHQWWQRRRVDLLLWVSATSRTAVLTRYSQAAADISGADDTDPEEAAVRLLGWLAGTHRRWLVILDDVTEPQDLIGLWPPPTPTGRTVVTTRRRDAALLAGRRLVDVAVFTPAEAVAYLHGKLGDHPARWDQAELLAADLGYLPLAVAQATAYLLDQDLSCAQYRQRLARRRLAALSPLALPDEHRNPIAATWTLSVELADRYSNRLARPLLELAALLDPNGIPATLFSTTAVVNCCTRRLNRLVEADDVGDTVRLLHRLSLANIDDTAGVVRVHALVQRSVRDATSDHDQSAVAVAAADALVELWPHLERDAAHAQPLRINAAALHTTSRDHLWQRDTGGHPVLLRAGASLGDAGLVDAAHTYFRQLNNTAVQQLGSDHLHTLTARGHAARWRGETGGLAGAATAFEQLLTDRLRVLGPDHPDTLKTRNDLADWQGKAGDPASAAAAFERLLTDVLRVLGPDCPDTLNARGNLARWRGEAGDPVGAVTAFEQLLTDRLRVLGPDHPDTLKTRHNLARWRGKAGDPDGAVTAFEQLLTDRLRVLGPDHPEVLNARYNCARWRGKAGDLSGAFNAFQQLLADCLRVLGPDHAETLNTRGNLACWRGEIGDRSSAVPGLFGEGVVGF